MLAWERLGVSPDVHEEAIRVMKVGVSLLILLQTNS